MSKGFTMMRVYKDTQDEFSEVVKAQRGKTVIGEMEIVMRKYISENKNEKKQ